MVINVLVTGVTVNQPFNNVVIFHNLTLTCKPQENSYLQPTYQWHRSGGTIPAKSMGSDSQQLTIPRVIPADQGEYYCIATVFGHCAVSDHAKVMVDGEKISYSLNSEGQNFHGIMNLAVSWISFCTLQ